MIAQATFGYVEVPPPQVELRRNLATRLDVIRVFRELGGIIRMIRLHLDDPEEWLGSIERSREATAHQVMMPLAAEREIFGDEELKHPSLQNNYERGIFPRPISDTVGDVYGADRIAVKKQGDAFFRERERRKEVRAKLKRAKSMEDGRERSRRLRRAMMRRELVAGRPYVKYWYKRRAKLTQKDPE